MIIHEGVFEAFPLLQENLLSNQIKEHLTIFVAVENNHSVIPATIHMVHSSREINA